MIIDTSEIEVGDYFVTRGGDIGQVTSLGAATNTLNSDIGLVFRTEITKFRKRLNDLVEAGDYVNGARISQSKSGHLSYNGGSLQSANIQQVMTAKKFYKECYSPNKQSVTWKTCVGFPKYEVSTSGIVRSKSNGKFMSLLRDRLYWSVRLESPDGRRIRKSVAVLVLETYVGSCSGRLPKFKDGDPENCSLDNLEWESRSEQAKRVLPRQSTGHADNFTYRYIIGYMMNKPIIYGDQSRDIVNKMQMRHEAFQNTSATHLVRSIKEDKTYKGIKFKCVPKPEYVRTIKTINLDNFNSLYTELIKEVKKPKTSKPTPRKPEQLQFKELVKEPKQLSLNDLVEDEKKTSQTVPKVVKDDPIIDVLQSQSIDDEIKHAKKDSKSLNEIDDSEFFKEQEKIKEEKRQKFKDELLRRLKQ